VNLICSTKPLLDWQNLAANLAPTGDRVCRTSSKAYGRKQDLVGDGVNFLAHLFRIFQVFQVYPNNTIYVLR
jgi:hypothetical protein